MLKKLYDCAMDREESWSPPPHLLVTGYWERESFERYRPRGSGAWLISYTLEGHGLYRQPGLELWTNPDDVVLLQPGALHDYCMPAGASWVFLWAHFHPRPSWLPWLQLPEVGQGLFAASLRSAQGRKRARQAFLDAHADACAADAIHGDLALNGLEEVLLLAVRENPARGRPPDPRVQQVLDLVSTDLAGPHDLRTLAQRVGLSPSRLAHLFHDDVGDSVNNTVLRLRLRQAARLLEFTGRGVGDVAEDVGFSSAFYFSRQFHRHYGISPRAYRAGFVRDQT